MGTVAMTVKKYETSKTNAKLMILAC